MVLGGDPFRARGARRALYVAFCGKEMVLTRVALDVELSCRSSITPHRRRRVGKLRLAVARNSIV